MGSTAPRVQSPEPKTGNMVRVSPPGLVSETVNEIARLSRNVWQILDLRPAFLEMIRLRNARTVNCQICKAVRYDGARDDGFTEEKADGRDLPRRERLALALADLYLKDPQGLTPELAGALKAEFSRARSPRWPLCSLPLTPPHAARSQSAACRRIRLLS